MATNSRRWAAGLDPIGLPPVKPQRLCAAPDCQQPIRSMRPQALYCSTACRRRTAQDSYRSRGGKRTRGEHRAGAPRVRDYYSPRYHEGDAVTPEQEARYRQHLTRLRRTGTYRVDPWAQRGDYGTELAKRQPDTAGLSSISPIRPVADRQRAKDRDAA